MKTPGHVLCCNEDADAGKKKIQCRPSYIIHDIDQLVFTSNFILPCHGPRVHDADVVHQGRIMACPFLAMPELANRFDSHGLGKNRVLV